MKGQTALITGATSGIGKAFAERFAAMGYDLILTGRRRQIITEIARKLKKTYRIQVTVIIAELTHEKGISSVITAIQKADRLSVLVNNAGYGVEGLFKNLTVTEHLDMMSVHMNAPMRFIHAALPRMLEQKNGIIINVASLGAFAPAPINGIYGGTKSFLVVLTESLHMEVRRHGVRVQALCPGFTHTDFHRKMGVEEELNRNKAVVWMTPKQVTVISMKCLEKGKVVCIPGFNNKILYALTRLTPRRLYYRMTEKLYRMYLD
jgi:short-subunit dehydrogenase